MMMMAIGGRFFRLVYIGDKFRRRRRAPSSGGSRLSDWPEASMSVTAAATTTMTMRRMSLSSPVLSFSTPPSSMCPFRTPRECRLLSPPAELCYTRSLRQYGSSSSSSSSGSTSRYDYYETLGVSQDATPQEIKKAFYSLSKRCHPDLHPDDERMAEKFKSLTIAYETLIDKEKRSAYDIENNFRRSTQQRWHGYSSAKHYPVAKGQRPQVSYAASDSSRRRERRRSEHSDSSEGSDAKDEWIRDQHRKMRQRLEEEDRQFKREWKEMMGSRSVTPGEGPGNDHHPLSEEEEKRWQEFQNKLEERRKEREKQMTFQNQRIAQHPALYYFYNMNWDWIHGTVWIVISVGGIAYMYYVIKNKDPETMPHRSMKRQFEEEGRLHKQKIAEKKERQKLLEAIWLERSLEKMRLEREEEAEKERKRKKEEKAKAAEDDDEDEEDDEEDEEDHEETEGEVVIENVVAQKNSQDQELPDLAKS